tara:strand:- start:108 stop:935 length:828 start_codon:yes stop_codon:yes gene_type:complete
MTRARDFADVISGNFDLPVGSLDNASGSSLFIRYANYQPPGTVPANTPVSIMGSNSGSQYGWSGQDGTLDAPLGSAFTVTRVGATTGGVGSTQHIGASTFRFDITNNTGSTINILSGTTFIQSNLTLAGGTSGASYIDSNINPTGSPTQILAHAQQFSTNTTANHAANASNSYTWTNGSSISYGFRFFSFGTHFNAGLTVNHLEMMFGGGVYNSGVTTASQGFRVAFAYPTLTESWTTLNATPQAGDDAIGFMSGSSASTNAADYEWMSYSMPTS